VALARLASATDGDQRARFAETARQALRYENTAFAGNNWYDFRIFEGLDPKVLQSRWMWCHGAPGIGLARAAMLDLAISPEDDLWRADLAVAANSTAEFGFGLNHSLCHGDLGNIEVLREAARLLGDSALAEAYESRLAQIAESIDRIGWSCGVPLGVENPGLFTGIAGIGYAWLRAAAPDHVPSVLLLSPPVP
jgi:lantibiotic modifying enzyme